jgi:hypothetical protein
MTSQIFDVKVVQLQLSKALPLKQCCGSVTYGRYWYGSGSFPAHHYHIIDLRIRILLFLSVADEMATKKFFCYVFFAYYWNFLKVPIHLHQLKSQKEVKKIVKVKVFLAFFAC